MSPKGPLSGRDARGRFSSKRKPWLSVVIPTIGRDSLFNTLESIRSQPEHVGVEVLVVADTHGGSTPALELAKARVEAMGLGCRWLEHDGGQHCVGHPQRTFGARAATAPYVWFSQDDNIAARDSLVTIMSTINSQVPPAGRPLFFRTQTFWGDCVWRVPFLDLGNIDADCLVFPQAIAQQVEWGLRYEGDFDAAVAAQQLAGGNAAWCNQVISIMRPQPAELWWLP